MRLVANTHWSSFENTRVSNNDPQQVRALQEVSFDNLEALK